MSIDVVAYLTAENLALRQQLIVLKRNQNRPQLKERDNAQLIRTVIEMFLL